MTRLVDLAPAWLLSGERRIGMTLLCPCCEGFGIYLLFANPPDGGPAQPPDHRVAGNHAGLRYRITGSTFDDLSVAGPILSSQAHHWAGRISDGEVSP